MPRLVSSHPSVPVIETELGAHHYWLRGLEITAPSDWTWTFSLVLLGDGGTAQNTLEKQAHHLVLDRAYVHGSATLDLRRCIGLNSGTTAIMDSWIADCHGRGTDTQAIAGWNGTGPYKIVNNYLEGAGENVMFGGADPAIQGLVPSDIEFRRNHVYKPRSWLGVWLVKNSFELKNAQRVLVEANVFENNWADGQSGFAIVLKSVNQSGGAPWSTTSDVTFRYNIIRNSPNGLALSGRPESHPAIPASRLHFAHNLFEGTAPDGRLWQLSGIRGLTLEHNTGFGGFNPVSLTVEKLTDLVIVNNIWGTSPNALVSDYSVGTGGLDELAPGWVFRGNVVVGARAALFPTGNHYPENIADVGFMNPATSDFRLRSTSPFAGTGPGVNMTDLNAALAGVVMR
jgi:hypothetical protein